MTKSNVGFDHKEICRIFEIIYPDFICTSQKLIPKINQVFPLV